VIKYRVRHSFKKRK